jgi:hypothetical protein
VTTALTIGETIEEIRIALTEYIEATYHISHPALIEQRRRLLEQVGVIHQEPFLESTPRYVTSDCLRPALSPPGSIACGNSRRRSKPRADNRNGLGQD